MDLTPDQTLLHYRIREKIGEGGMGVVWRATDTRLGRDVAIKLLPHEVADDPRRLARFEREARVLAAMSHPNIVTIHAVEHVGDVRFLVMEYIRGTSLVELIPPRGLPGERLLDLALPITEAVAEAHRQGVTHRDLKPGNVVITEDGRPKVLDFGLAKATGAEQDAESPTATSVPMTAVGTVIGTTAYMSPEQAEGRPLDARSDIFSLGVMLYEMATGHRPFHGESTARLVSSILTEEPAPLGATRPDMPEYLARIVHRCLEKDLGRRFQTAAELRDELLAAREARRAPATAFSRPTHESRGPTPGIRGPWVVGALGLLIAMVLALLAVWQFAGPGESRHAPRPGPGDSPFVARKLSQLTFDAATEQWAAWSPDGARLVYCKESEGYSKLFSKDTSTDDTRQLTFGPRDDVQPAFSPDGKTIAFVRATAESGKLVPSDALTGDYREGDVWLLDLDTGTETRIIEEAFNPAFSPDGSRVAVDASWAGPRRLWTTDVRGHNPQQITSGTSEEVKHTQPSWSPDGTRIVFRHAEKTKYDIHVADVATGETVPVTDDPYLDLDPLWSPSGEHVYMASYRGGGLNVWRVPVQPDGRPAGPPEQLTTGAGQDIQPALTRNGDRLAFTVLLQNSDLWRLATDPATGRATGAPRPLVVSTREDSRGAWSPDGRRLAFNSDRDGEMNLWILSTADGTTRPLTRGPGGDYQPRWSRDGDTIAFFSARSGNADVWTVDVDSGALRQITDHPALDTNPAFSPDGNRIAFQSDRDGRKEVWLVDADGGNPRRLTTVGATDHYLRWSDDGRWVYFRSSGLTDNGICRVPADGGDVEPLGVPVGWHLSFSPDRTLILDAVGHRGLWVYPVDGSERREVWVAADPEVRIDYPDWSPDGRHVVFDRVKPRGGDVWLLELQ